MSNDKDYMRKYMLLRYHRIRNEIIVTLGGKCVVCGRTDNLEIDHIDPAKKTMNIGKLTSVSRKRLDEEVKLCQLLCTDHHKDKTSVFLSETRSGSSNPNSFLTDDDVRSIRQRVASGETQRSVARSYNMSHSTVNLIVKRKSYRNVT